MARPGAVSRAHRGVLFLDECAEIRLSAHSRRCEHRWRTARFAWPAATGWRAIPLGSNWCWLPTRARARRPIRRIASVRPRSKRRYLGKLSGPLLDRVDLRVQMNPVRAGAFSAVDGESTAQVRHRVARRATRPPSAGAARISHQRRSQRTAAAAKIPSQQRRDDPTAHRPGPGAAQHRGLDRTLRVAWSLADLAGRDSPGLGEVAAALSFRQPGAQR